MFHYGSFRFQLATTPDLMEATQKLRYRVYSSEKGWEKPENHPNGLETDPFDRHSVHAAALNQEGAVIGTGRLVLNSPLGLPIFPLMEEVSEFDPRSPRIAEFSRLCVDPDFRLVNRDPEVCHQSSGYYRSPGARVDTTPSQDARNESAIMNGLIHILHQASIRMRLTHWLMVSEKKLWVLLKRQGIVFRPAGKPVEYHGTRIPYIARLDVLDHSLARLHLDTTKRFAGTVTVR